MSENKRLLAISFSLPPALGARSLQVGKSLDYLARVGWSVRVLSVLPDSSINSPVMDEELSKKYLEWLVVDRVPIPISTKLAPYWRWIIPAFSALPDDQKYWAKRAENHLLRTLSPDSFDALISFAHPWSDHLLGCAIKGKWQIPWLAHFSDPWVDNPLYSFNPRQKKHMLEMEKEVVQAADSLVFTSERTIDLVMKKYSEDIREKALTIQHGYDPSLLPIKVDERMKLPKKMHIVHTGNFYGLRSPAPIIEAMRQLKDDGELIDSVVISLVGNVKNLPKWQKIIREQSLQNNLRFLPSVNYNDSLGALEAADVLLLVDSVVGDQPSVFIPSKLVDYIMIGKPILGVTTNGSVSKTILNDFSFPSANPDRPDELALAIQNLFNLWKRKDLKKIHLNEDQKAKYSIEESGEILNLQLLELIGRSK